MIFWDRDPSVSSANPWDLKSLGLGFSVVWDFPQKTAPLITLPIISHWLKLNRIWTTVCPTCLLEATAANWFAESQKILLKFYNLFAYFSCWKMKTARLRKNRTGWSSAVWWGTRVTWPLNRKWRGAVQAQPEPNRRNQPPMDRQPISSLLISSLYPNRDHLFQKVRKNLGQAMLHLMKFRGFNW